MARKVVKDATYTVALTAEKVNEFLGVTKFRDTLANEKSEIGLVTGLAWTEVGGSILSIEVAIVDGKGKLTITGQLGDVMQESAHAAMSYVRSRALRLGIPRTSTATSIFTFTCLKAPSPKTALLPALPWPRPYRAR